MNTSYTPSEIKTTVEKFTGHTDVQVDITYPTITVQTESEQLLVVTAVLSGDGIWYLHEVQGCARTTGLRWHVLLNTLVALSTSF